LMPGSARRLRRWSSEPSKGRHLPRRGRGRVTRKGAHTFTRLFATRKCARRAARCACTGGETQGGGWGEGVRTCVAIGTLGVGNHDVDVVGVGRVGGGGDCGFSDGRVVDSELVVGCGVRTVRWRRVWRARAPTRAHPGGATVYFLSGNFLFVKVRRERCRRIGPQRIHHDEAQGPEGARQCTLPKNAGRRSEEACRDEAHAPGRLTSRLQSPKKTSLGNGGINLRALRTISPTCPEQKEPARQEQKKLY
jgi:hypothetical protein